MEELDKIQMQVIDILENSCQNGKINAFLKYNLLVGFTQWKFVVEQTIEEFKKGGFNESHSLPKS